LGLFDAADTRAPARHAAPAKQPKPPQTGRAKPASSPAPERAVVLNPREAAQYLGVSVSTLKAWRAKKVGPKWSMRGARLVAYRPADLERFLDESSAER
jgi:predicted DNA-binding transcriptional regulator AlpA